MAISLRVLGSPCVAKDMQVNACMSSASAQALSQRRVSGDPDEAFLLFGMQKSDSGEAIPLSGMTFCCSGMTIWLSGMTIWLSGMPASDSGKAFLLSRKAFWDSGMTFLLSGKAFRGYGKLSSSTWHHEWRDAAARSGQARAGLT